MRVVAFKSEHLRTLELQDAQRYFSGSLSSAEYAQALQKSDHAFTAVVGETVIMCAGCVQIWENRAMAWALVSKDAGRHMIGAHRAVAGFLAASPWRRVEAYVDVGFEAGMRWMAMLGFTLETPEPMRAYRPDGGDCYLFARVK